MLWKGTSGLGGKVGWIGQMLFIEQHAKHTSYGTVTTGDCQRYTIFHIHSFNFYEKAGSAHPQRN